MAPIDPSKAWLVILLLVVVGIVFGKMGGGDLFKISLALLLLFILAAMQNPSFQMLDFSLFNRQSVSPNSRVLQSSSPQWRATPQELAQLSKKPERFPTADIQDISIPRRATTERRKIMLRRLEQFYLQRRDESPVASRPLSEQG